MSWFEDAFLWPTKLTSGKGRAELKDDIKHGKGAASMGSPLHGPAAGYSAHKATSPTVHMNDRIQDLKSNGTSGHVERSWDDLHHYWQDAFKENWPVLVAGAANFAGGAGAGGEAGAAGVGGELAATPSIAGTGGASLGGAGGVGAGLEGVTVVGSTGGGLSAAETAALAAGAGGGAAAVTNPNMGMQEPQGESGGSSWQDMAGKMGANFSKMSEQEQDQTAAQLAAMGPPPNLEMFQHQGPPQGVGDVLAQLQAGSKPKAMPGEASTNSAYSTQGLF